MLKDPTIMSFSQLLQDSRHANSVDIARIPSPHLIKVANNLLRKAVLWIRVSNEERIFTFIKWISQQRSNTVRTSSLISGELRASSLTGPNPPTCYVDMDRLGLPRFITSYDYTYPSRKARCLIYYLARCTKDLYMREQTFVRTLTMLDLSNCGLDSFDMHSIARALRVCSSVSTLCLRGNRIAAGIDDILVGNDVLRTLDLAHNMLGEQEYYYMHRRKRDEIRKKKQSVRAATPIRAREEQDAHKSQPRRLQIATDHGDRYRGRSRL